MRIKQEPRVSSPMRLQIGQVINSHSLVPQKSDSGFAAYTVLVCEDNQPCQNLVANPGASGTYLYEGDPEHPYTFRVTATDHVDNATTKESGASTAAVTKYYLFGGQRVAMRVGTGDQSAVYFLHGDHPSRPFRTGSGRVSMTTNALGEIVCQMR